jgi:hypothetical protein
LKTRNVISNATIRPKMNNGKICIPVCAATVDEMLEQIKRAEDLADVVEIRFDCLDKIQFLKAFAFFASKSVLLFTFRPESQGGKAIDDFSGRMLWSQTEIWIKERSGSIASSI